MSHTVTEADFIRREDSGDLYYTGPLEEAKAFIRREFAVSVSKQGASFVVLLGNEEPVTWETCNDWGKGLTEEEAWRYALGAELGSESGVFEPFDLPSDPPADPRYYWEPVTKTDNPHEPFGAQTALIVDDKIGRTVIFCHETNADLFVKILNESDPE